MKIERLKIENISGGISEDFSKQQLLPSKTNNPRKFNFGLFNPIRDQAVSNISPAVTTLNNLFYPVYTDGSNYEISDVLFIQQLGKYISIRSDGVLFLFTWNTDTSLPTLEPFVVSGNSPLYLKLDSTIDNNKTLWISYNTDNSYFSIYFTYTATDNVSYIGRLDYNADLQIWNYNSQYYQLSYPNYPHFGVFSVNNRNYIIDGYKILSQDPVLNIVSTLNLGNNFIAKGISDYGEYVAIIGDGNDTTRLFIWNGSDPYSQFQYDIKDEDVFAIQRINGELCILSAGRNGTTKLKVFNGSAFNEKPNFELPSSIMPPVTSQALKIYKNGITWCDQNGYIWYFGLVQQEIGCFRIGKIDIDTGETIYPVFLSRDNLFLVQSKNSVIEAVLVDTVDLTEMINEYNISSINDIEINYNEVVAVNNNRIIGTSTTFTKNYLAGDTINVKGNNTILNSTAPFSFLKNRSGIKSETIITNDNINFYYVVEAVGNYRVYLYNATNQTETIIFNYNSDVGGYTIKSINQLIILTYPGITPTTSDFIYFIGNDATSTNNNSVLWRYQRSNTTFTRMLVINTQSFFSYNFLKYNSLNFDDTNNFLISLTNRNNIIFLRQTGFIGAGNETWTSSIASFPAGVVENISIYGTITSNLVDNKSYLYFVPRTGNSGGEFQAGYIPLNRGSNISNPIGNLYVGLSYISNYLKENNINATFFNFGGAISKPLFNGSGMLIGGDVYLFFSVTNTNQIFIMKVSNQNVITPYFRNISSSNVKNVLSVINNIIYYINNDNDYYSLLDYYQQVKILSVDNDLSLTVSRNLPTVFISILTLSLQSIIRNNDLEIYNIQGINYNIGNKVKYPIGRVDIDMNIINSNATITLTNGNNNIIINYPNNASGTLSNGTTQVVIPAWGSSRRVLSVTFTGGNVFVSGVSVPDTISATPQNISIRSSTNLSKINVYGIKVYSNLLISNNIQISGVESINETQGRITTSVFEIPYKSNIERIYVKFRKYNFQDNPLFNINIYRDEFSDNPTPLFSYTIPNVSSNYIVTEYPIRAPITNINKFFLDIFVNKCIIESIEIEYSFNPLNK